MSSVQGSRTANSDRPLSERVRVQVTDDTGYGRGCFVFGDQLCEIAALEAEVDDLREIVYWAHYTGRTRCLCPVCVAYGANPTALEGGDDGCS